MARLTAQSPPAARMRAVLGRLRRAYPEARIALSADSPWQLLVATVLSAQCTDERVNQVTPELFRRYPQPADYAAADEAELAAAIYRTGYHNQKARALRGAARVLLERYDGRVPRRVDDLVTLPGVGRKTAAVVSGNAFGRNDGIAVDTHVGRLVRRLGFTAETDPVKVERVLMELVPRSAWTLFTHLLIAHGRAVCSARAPRCEACVLLSLCPFGQSSVGRTAQPAAQDPGARPAAQRRPAKSSRRKPGSS